MRISTSNEEIKDLLKAWIMISLAFAIVLSGGLSGLSNINFLFMLLISGIAVGSGFLFHELAHKITAQKYGCYAEFRSFDNMLFLALAMSFFGFVFAAPGAVMIRGYVSKDRNGKISLAGPLTNIILAVIFLFILLLININIINQIAFYGFFINSLLAVFNLLPFGNFDGAKIRYWNKTAHTIAIIISIMLVVGSYMLF